MVRIVVSQAGLQRSSKSPPEPALSKGSWLTERDFDIYDIAYIIYPSYFVHVPYGGSGLGDHLGPPWSAPEDHLQSIACVFFEPSHGDKNRK